MNTDKHGWRKWEWGKAKTVRFWVWLVIALAAIMLVQRKPPSDVLWLLFGMVVFVVAMYQLEKKVGAMNSGPPNLQFSPDYEGVCPCGKKFFVDALHYAVIHELPMCEKFKTLEVVEYLRYVRQAITPITDN
jgi:hypothetical protein